MRIHPWLAALSSLLLLVTAGESSAQTTNRVDSSTAFQDAVEGHVRLTSSSTSTSEDALTKPEVRGQSPGGYPGTFQPGYTSNNPADLWPAGTPQTYQPYPQISPYMAPNVSRTTNFNRDGLWFREMLYRKRTYFTTLEYLMVRYRNPGNSIIGATPAAVLSADPTTGTGGAGGGGGGAGGGGAGGANQTGGLAGVILGTSGLADGGADIGAFSTLGRFDTGPGVFPFPFIVTAVNNNTIFTRTAIIDENAVPIRSLSYFDNPLKSDGMRARWGYFNEDDSGLMITGWFGLEQEEERQHGVDAVNGFPMTQARIIANAPTGGVIPVFPRNGGLPLELRADLNAGSILGTLGYTGETQRFDVLFEYEVATMAAGGAIHLYHEPIYKRKWVTVRPTFGARYQYLDERLNFRGIDSGLGYDIAAAGAGGQGGGGGNNQDLSFRPDTGSLVIPLDNNLENFFFEAGLESQVDSHMAGPEAGLRYDFGSGKNFSIWGQTTVGLLANHERIQLSGRNIGDPITYFQTTGLNFTKETDGLDTNFIEEETHTHASPLFEQSVFIDAAVFKHIPVLNKMHLLENARFRTGYTLTVIGDVARPGELVHWKGFPDTPTIRNDQRKTWSTHNWSFAIDWQF